VRPAGAVIPAARQRRRHPAVAAHRPAPAQQRAVHRGRQPALRLPRVQPGDA
ncbi:MAG: hypothetical protein AVDCRST_MAG54-2092, partial [uncultured Actinomycetospora sp.]